MSLKETERNKSLKQRYSTYKTTEISFNTDNQEDPQSKINTNLKEVATGTVTPQFEKRKSEPLNDFNYSQDTTIVLESQKLTREVEELKTKLDKEITINLENKQQLLHLQENLKQQKQTIEKQERQLSDLNNVLAGKSKEVEQAENKLLLTKNLLKEQEERFQQLLGASKQEDQLKVALSDSEGKLEKTLIALKKESGQNVKHTEKILALIKSLEEASKIEHQLETFLSNETAKNKKLQEELEFVISNVNQEKEDLYNNFEEFKAATVTFLQSCDTHKDIVLRAAEEGKM